MQAGAERFERAEPAASGAIEDIVRGFDRALQGALRDLVAWTVSTGAAARAAG